MGMLEPVAGMANANMYGVVSTNDDSKDGR
jgi:hypothetical protein